MSAVRGKVRILRLPENMTEKITPERKRTLRELINSCRKKEIKYADESTARECIAVLEKKKLRFGLEAYECVFCGGWHVGHPLLYRPATRYAYWCQDVLTCLVPVIQAAPTRKQAQEAYRVAKGAMHFRAALMFLTLKAHQHSLVPVLFKNSCKRIGLTRDAAMKRLREVFMETQ